MNSSRAFAVLLAAVPVTLAEPLAPPAARRVEGPAFHPEAGAQLRKTFREVSEWELDSASNRINGEERDSGEVELEASFERELVVLDEYVTSEGGRPTELVRRYESLAIANRVDASEDGREDNASGTLGSELESAAVKFTWDDDGEEYTAEFHGDDADDYDADLLEGLWEDCDLRSLLPAGEVEVGDEWELDAAGLAPVLRPGGDLRFSLDPDDVEGDPEGIILSCFWSAAWAADSVEGSASARYAGAVEEDGRELAEIALEVDLTAGGEPLDTFLRLANEIESGFVEDASEFSMEYAIEGEGRLLWDLEAGRLHSLELEGESTAELLFVLEPDFGGESMTFELEISLVGTTRIEVTSEEL